MAKTITVKLREPIIGHQGAINEIVLQAPSLTQYAAIGEPVSVMRPDGLNNPVVVENDAAISAYLDCCIVEPKDKLLLDQVQLADAMEIKEHLLDFFATARQAKP